jgi:hypothetical protein
MEPFQRHESYDLENQRESLEEVNNSAIPIIHRNFSMGEAVEPERNMFHPLAPSVEIAARSIEP